MKKIRVPRHFFPFCYFSQRKTLQWYSFLLVHAVAYPLAHTHTHTHSLSLSRLHTHIHTLTLSRLHTHTRSHAHSLSLSLFLQTLNLKVLLRRRSSLALVDFWQQTCSFDNLFETFARLNLSGGGRTKELKPSELNERFWLSYSFFWSFLSSLLELELRVHLSHISRDNQYNFKSALCQYRDKTFLLVLPSLQACFRFPNLLLLVVSLLGNPVEVTKTTFVNSFCSHRLPFTDGL